MGYGTDDYQSLDTIRRTNPTIAACGLDGDDHDGFPWDDITSCIERDMLCKEVEEKEEEPDLSLGAR